MSNRIQRTQKEVELAPCPFCGGKVKITFDLKSPIKGVFCPQCKMFLKFNDLLSSNADIEAWQEKWNNRR